MVAAPSAGLGLQSPLAPPVQEVYTTPMAILEIIEVPDPILKQVAKPVVEVDDRIRRLLDDMAETMYAAPGIGLAAPQVGVLERVVVVAVPVRDALAEEREEDEKAGTRAFLTELINPIIVERDGECAFEEGCLSVPDIVVSVDRAEHIVMERLKRELGCTPGLLAILALHFAARNAAHIAAVQCRVSWLVWLPPARALTMTCPMATISVELCWHDG